MACPIYSVHDIWNRVASSSDVVQ